MPRIARGADPGTPVFVRVPSMMPGGYEDIPGWIPGWIHSIAETGAANIYWRGVAEDLSLRPLAYGQYPVGRLGLGSDYGWYPR